MNRARNFFFASCGLLMLAVTYQLGVSSAIAIGSSGTSAAVSGPEVATLQGVGGSGFQIPLPTYADGTQALESECTWIVSDAYQWDSTHWCYAANGIYGIPPSVNDANFFAARKGRIINVGVQGANDGVANYLIVAVRSGQQPTGNLKSNWGELKAKYR